LVTKRKKVVLAPLVTIGSLTIFVTERSAVGVAVGVEVAVAVAVGVDVAVAVGVDVAVAVGVGVNVAVAVGVDVAVAVGVDVAVAVGVGDGVGVVRSVTVKINSPFVTATAALVLEARPLPSTVSVPGVPMTLADPLFATNV